MIQRNGLFIVTAAVAVVLSVLLWLLRPSSPRTAHAVQSPTPDSRVSPAVALSFVSPTPKPLLVENLTGKAMSEQEALQRYVARFRDDPIWEGKVPLNFYGKVVDQDDRPVSGANVRLDWNTTREFGGTVLAETVSDNNGLFSLTNQHGKDLGVRIEKNGYYTVERGGAEVSFEYANPSSNEYYQPDANKPVIFHLRKKGEGARLVTKTVNLSLPGKALGGMDLMSGQFAPAGSLQVQSNKPDFKTARGRYSWSVTLSMPSGGLIETSDQFPFTAPQSGYVQTANIDMTNPNSPSWGNGAMKTYYFYLPNANTYGLIHVSTLGATSHVYLNYSYNPRPGDRNLEPASN